MAKNRLCCIGYITKDKIVTPQSTVEMPGGTSYYFAKALQCLDTRGFQLVTAVGSTEMPVVDDLRQQGIQVECLPTRQSICFENIYSGFSQSERKQRVTALPDPFTLEGLQVVDADVIHLGSLLGNDFSLDVIKYLATKGRLSADVQGFLRQVRGEQVYPVDWEEKLEALKYIHTLKANVDEMITITQCDEPHEAALMLADWGVKEVLLTFDEKGSLIYTKGQFIDIPAYPTLQVVDATGCGDTYMVGYLHMRSQGASEYEAGCFAAAMCTIKLQGHGPFAGTEESVRRIMASSSSLDKLNLKL